MRVAHVHVLVCVLQPVTACAHLAIGGVYLKNVVYELSVVLDVSPCKAL